MSLSSNAYENNIGYLNLLGTYDNQGATAEPEDWVAVKE